MKTAPMLLSLGLLLGVAGNAAADAGFNVPFCTAVVPVKE